VAQQRLAAETELSLLAAPLMGSSGAGTRVRRMEALVLRSIARAGVARPGGRR